MRFLWSPRAKVDRATEQLKALNAEVLELRKRPSPFTQIVQRDKSGGHHVFRLYPAWEPGAQRRWAVIVGEIVHDLRSALDHIVWEGIELSNGKPDREHAFPFRKTEPSEGFARWATRTWRSKDGRKRHGKLYGLDEAAVELIERCQPYQGGDTPKLLAHLDALWQCDKHRMLLPVVLPMVEPPLKLADCEFVKRTPDRVEDGAYVVEVWVRPTGPNPQVDVEASAPFDIAVAERPIIEDLREVAMILLILLLDPMERLFPDEEDLEHNRAKALLQEHLQAARASAEKE